MSVLDRLTDAINGDSPITPAEQTDLVLDVLARRLRWECPICLHSFREPFCDMCGHVLTPEHLVREGE